VWGLRATKRIVFLGERIEKGDGQKGEILKQHSLRTISLKGGKGAKSSPRPTQFNLGNRLVAWENKIEKKKKKGKWIKKGGFTPEVQEGD